MQTGLNLFLARVLHVCGAHTALFGDTGIQPFTWIQYTHLAQMHFRLTKTRLNTLSVIVFKTLNK